MIDEENRQMRDGELGAATSSSRLEDVERSTTEGAEIAGGHHLGFPYRKGCGFREIGPICLLIFGAMHLKFASPINLFLYFL